MPVDNRRSSLTEVQDLHSAWVTCHVLILSGMISLIKNVRGTRALCRLRLSVDRHATTLVVAEHDNVSLSPSSLSAVTAARELKGDVTLLVMGYESQAVAEQVVCRPSYLVI